MRSSKLASLNLLQLEDRITPAVAFALSNNSLIGFDTLTSDITQPPQPISGLNGETLVGIDFRPQNGMLYGLTSNGSGVKLYAISERTGVATPLTSNFQQFDDGLGNSVPISGTQFGIDFNPQADRIRVVSNTGVNFRLDPNTGLIVDGNLTTPGINSDTNLNVGGTASGSDASAYTNNVPNTSITTLYTLDSTTDRLFIQNPPNSGALTTPLPVSLNGATLNFTAINGFDIPAGVNAPAANQPAVGFGLAVLQVAGLTNLYQIDLSTGVATLVRPVGDGSSQVQGFAVQSEASSGAIPVVALTTGNSIVRFSSSSTTAVSTPVAIAGLNSGESVVGISYRPTTGQLYGLVSNGSGVRLIIIDPQTGASSTAAMLTTPQQFNDGVGNNIPITGTAFGVDFNPTVDRVRVVTNTGFNFRMNPNTGALLDGDLGMSTIQPGINPDGSINGATTLVGGTAYTNSFSQVPGSVATTQFTIDAASDSIYQQRTPNSGTQVNRVPITLGGAALDFTAVGGFDIPAGIRVSTSDTLTSGRSIAALTVNGVTSLYSIELSTGVATSLGSIGTGAVTLSGIALANSPEGTVFFPLEKATVKENAGTTTLNLTRTGGSVGNLTVVINATGGTAISGTDYSGTPIIVSFADGQTTAAVPFTLIDNQLLTGNKTVRLTLSNPTSGAVIGSHINLLLTILENDQPVVQTTSLGGVVTVTNADDSLRLSLRPFPTFGGSVTVAEGDVTGDSIPDLIVGAGAGGGPHVKVFDGATGQEIASFFAFVASFQGGVFVSTSDVNGDGRADIVVGAGAGGGPHVKVFDGTTFGEIRSFFAFNTDFTGGVRVAGGDVNGDGIGDLIVAAGAGGGPHVRVLSGLTGSELMSFFAYDPQFTGGVFLASGDLNGDGFADIFTGAGSTAPHVTAVNGLTGQQIRSFFAYDSAFAGGVRVAAVDLNQDGVSDIVTGPGAGTVPRVRTFDGVSLGLLSERILTDPTFLQGVFVG